METPEVVRLEAVRPPWYLSVLIGIGLGFAYTLSGLTWLWWKTGEYAYRFAREMREALWRRHQVLNGWVDRAVVLAEKEESKRCQH